jgi:hypothetical protein
MNEEKDLQQTELAEETMENVTGGYTAFTPGGPQVVVPSAGKLSVSTDTDDVNKISTGRI